MRKLFLAIFMASSVLCWADDVRVSSPDGNLVVTVNIRNGVPSYSATLFNKPVIEQSALGLKTSVGNFTCSLFSVFNGSSTQQVPDARHKGFGE